MARSDFDAANAARVSSRSTAPDATASSLARYEDSSLPAPVGIPDELDTKPPPQRQLMQGMDGKETMAAIWWSRANPERIRRMRKHYYANITQIDDWVGEIVAAP